MFTPIKLIFASVNLTLATSLCRIPKDRYGSPKLDGQDVGSMLSVKLQDFSNTLHPPGQPGELTQNSLSECLSIQFVTTSQTWTETLCDLPLAIRPRPESSIRSLASFLIPESLLAISQMLEMTSPPTKPFCPFRFNMNFDRRIP
jgi:hypothetical protein